MGTSERPRVSVFKSNKNIFVQFIDDTSGKTILSNKLKKSASRQKINNKKEDKTKRAQEIGQVLASEVKKAGITTVVFDRGGFKYHGRVKAVADGLRKGGIKF